MLYLKKTNLFMIMTSMILSGVVYAVDVPFYNVTIQPGGVFSAGIETTGNQSIKCTSSNINPKEASWEVYMNYHRNDCKFISSDIRSFRGADHYPEVSFNYEPKGHSTLCIRPSFYPPVTSSIQVTCEYVIK